MLYQATATEAATKAEAAAAAAAAVESTAGDSDNRFTEERVQELVDAAKQTAEQQLSILTEKEATAANAAATAEAKAEASAESLKAAVAAKKQVEIVLTKVGVFITTLLRFPTS